jgi:hypothetical protein
VCIDELTAYGVPPNPQFAQHLGAGNRGVFSRRFCQESNLAIDDRIVKKLYEWKPISTRLAGRPKVRWGNYI